MTDIPAQSPEDGDPAEKPLADQTPSPPEHQPSEEAIRRANHIIAVAEKQQEVTPVADPDTGH